MINSLFLLGNPKNTEVNMVFPNEFPLPDSTLCIPLFLNTYVKSIDGKNKRHLAVPWNWYSRYVSEWVDLRKNAEDFKSKINGNDSDLGNK